MYLYVVLKEQSDELLSEAIKEKEKLKKKK